VITITNGVPSATTVNLTGMNDGTITSTLALNKDAAGNSFTPVTGNAVTLDRDSGEQTALSVTVNGGSATVLTANAGTVAVSIAALQSDDNGTLTFSDGVTAHNQVITITNEAFLQKLPPCLVGIEAAATCLYG
jgi:hypothetical protein